MGGVGIVSSLSINLTELVVGEEYPLTVDLTLTDGTIAEGYSDAAQVKWSSSDTSIVEIQNSTDSQTGLTTAKAVVLAEGEVTISAKLGQIVETVALEAAVNIWDQLIAAGQNGTYLTKFPVGTIFKTPYSYDGTEYEWEFAVDYSNEVAQDGNTYLVANLWSVYGTVENVKWNSSENNRYKNSTIRTFINGDWLNRFTDTDFTSRLAATKVKTLPYDSTTADITTDKVFLPSTSEINVLASSNSSLPPDDAEGYASGYWKQRTGSTSRLNYNTAMTWRILTISDKSTSKDTWLRSARRYDSTATWYCSTSGRLSSSYITINSASCCIAPTCRILLKKV